MSSQDAGVEVGEEVNHIQKILIFAAMKPWLHILLSCFLLAACAKHEAPPPEEDMLYRVECFYQQNPDSAIQILDTLDVSVLTEDERAHYDLLLARTMAMLNMDQKMVDSLIDEAENHYAGGNDKYHEAMTYWHKAWKTSETNKLDYRQKALQTIGQCRHVDERLVLYSEEPTDEQTIIDRLKFAIHQRLGMSYLSTGYVTEAIMHLKLSEQYYEATHRHKLHIVSAYMLSHAYTLVNEHDSSLLYLEKGYRSAQAIGNLAECAYYHIGVSEHCLYRHDMQQYADEAERLALINQSSKECHSALRLLDTLNGRMVNDYRIDSYGNLSRTYCLLQKYDSCVYFGRIVLDALGDRTSVFQLKNLYKAYKGMGDEANAALMADRLIGLPDDHGAEQKAIAEVKDEYDRQLELQRIENEHQTNRLKLYLLIAVLVIALLLTWLFVNRYRKNKEIETLHLHEEHLRLQSDNLRIAHAVSQNLLKRVHKIYNDGKNDAFQRILAEFDATYPKARRNVMETYPTLSEQEYGLCVLGFLAFRAKEVAQLMDLSENTINHYRTNIRKKTGVDDLKSLIKAQLE